MKKPVRIAICIRMYILNNVIRFEDGIGYRFEYKGKHNHNWSEPTYRIYMNMKSNHSIVLGEKMFKRHFRIFI